MADYPQQTGNSGMADFKVLSEKDQEVLEIRLHGYQQQLLDSWDHTERLLSRLIFSAVLNVVLVIALVGLALSV